jgi:tricorn protease
MRTRTWLALALLGAVPVGAQTQLGYYRFPSLHGDTVVFTAEGDLWRVGVQGGVAQRLTSHPAEEGRPAISPDGKQVAFSARYEGPAEVYVMPLEGGIPRRLSWEGGNSLVVGWTPPGEVLYATRRFSTLPDTQLVTVDPATGKRSILPLAQASDGGYDGAGRTLFFTRFAFQGSHTKRYQGGTAQKLWKWGGGGEAVPLTADFAGTSKTPMWWNGRVYFVSDRDGTMNLWSMDEDGRDLRQHTTHQGWDVQSPSLSAGRIVYQLGADLRLLDTSTGADQALPVRLVSDFDQLREKWVKNPMEFVTAAHVSPSGDRIALTARGQVFVAPVQPGRLVEVTRARPVRWREARFMPDGKSLVALSDESGEVELWTLAANGVGEPQRLTSDGKVLRWEAVPSPDGKWIAHRDKDQQLWLYDVAARKSTRIASSANSDFSDLAWSPDSRWLAYAVSANNGFQQLFLHGTEGGKSTALSTDRYDSGSPAWSPDGKWIYFVSNRNLQSLVDSPWGSRQPEPFFDRQTRIYHVALVKGLRSPFLPADELQPPSPSPSPSPKASASPAPAASPPPPRVAIDIDGLAGRIQDVPAPPGNYESVATDGERLYWLSVDTSLERKKTLKALEVEPRKQPVTLVEDVKSFELSQDRKKLMLRKGDDVYVFAPSAKPPDDLPKAAVDLKGWTFALDPREEFRQMFVEAWRLERDYFYDRNMHGVDWPAMRDKYLPLVARVTDRGELSDLLAQMVGELSALHIFVYGGEQRKGADDVVPATLGAVLIRDETAGGARVEHVYRADPDRPDRLSPLARPGVDVGDGDVVTAINGVATLSVPDPAALLRNQADKQVLLHVKAKGGAVRDVIAMPLTPAQDRELRYDEWEYARRLEVERMGQGKIGYVHLRAMGPNDVAQWAREFYPVFDREGLVIDVRHNNGGNIDSWILEKLLRKAWFYWQPRLGNPTWNMQYAFRGHLVVLCDAGTASDGEAFAEGFRRLGLGKLIGTRTWGGEIWLTSSNVLVDRGIATAAEFGVYGPEGEWLIEGHGVDPDVVVDNLPHATFEGKDPQLEAAVAHLQEQIRLKPVPVPSPPRYPDKSDRKKKSGG